ncbi:MAG TPA: M36 family metallopeptidase [Actinomycetota bacterium]|nr:M36 family metallopeptidase [Actinomycetota bacterium]
MTTRRSRRWLGGTAALAVALVVLSAMPGTAQQARSGTATGSSGARTRSAAATYDARSGVSARMREAVRSARLLAQAPPALRRLRTSLGTQGVVELDPVTATPRIIAKLNGFLSGPRAGSARAIAMHYVRTHAAAFGVTDPALRSLSFVRDYVSIDGTHHVAWTQRYAGVPVFGSGLQVNVTRDGRVINVLGSPVGGLGAVGTAATVPASRAIATAVSDAKLTHVTGLPRVTEGGAIRRGAPTATKVFFPRPDGTHLAWQTYVWGEQGLFLSVIDARSGAVLYRHSLTDDANGRVFENSPGAPAGGVQHTVNLTPYLYARNRLFGPRAWVSTDVNDDNVVQTSEEVRPNARGNWTFPFVPFTNTVDSACPAKYPCSWNSRRMGGFSWKTNRRQSATQLFWFLNRYALHLQAAPIGFTPAAGNFQLFNPSGKGLGGDPVLGQALDGANTLNLGHGLIGLPDFNHTDNANMSTPPDGFAPTMQMYLWNDPLTNIAFGPRADPFIQSNGADEADIVFHEYTHGLSNRLVVDANGVSTLGNLQAGAMGEAWSDWYAMDYLVNRGLFKDTAAPGQLLEGTYVSGGKRLVRTEAIDCPVGSAAPRCRGANGLGKGGYTYGDFGKIFGTPEVHADGEIWGQTLWDLRTVLGSKITEGLVTRAMELSPANPSFLDERNAILQADQVLHAGAHRTTIWKTFAHRGMGYFASAIDGDDTQPVQDFSMPPSGSPNATLSGTVRDSETLDPIEGAVVSFGGHDSGFVGDLVGVTDAAGHYSIPSIFAHAYAGVNAAGAGYDRVVASLTIVPGANTRDWSLDRDWAAAGGGATIASFNGPDYTTFGCGPINAIDQSQGIGWGSTTDTNAGDDTGSVTPKHLVIALPATVDISAISVDPGPTCGDDASAATHDYTVEVSANGTTWTTAATGSFFAGDVGVMNPVTLGGSTTGVNFVRFTMLDPMVPMTGDTCDDVSNCPAGTGSVAARCGPAATDPGFFDGCSFMDMSEIEVYGTPS